VRKKKAEDGMGKFSTPTDSARIEVALGLAAQHVDAQFGRGVFSDPCKKKLYFVHLDGV
jgi:hypothetical protein